MFETKGQKISNVIMFSQTGAYGEKLAAGLRNKCAAHTSWRAASHLLRSYFELVLDVVVNFLSSLMPTALVD